MERKSISVCDYFATVQLGQDALELLDYDSTLAGQGDSCSKAIRSTWEASIQDVCLLVPKRGDICPHGYEIVEKTPCGNRADLNSGSLYSSSVFLAYRKVGAAVSKPSAQKGRITYISGIEVVVADKGARPKAPEVLDGWELVCGPRGGEPVNINKGGDAMYLAVRRTEMDFVSGPDPIVSIVVLIVNRGDAAPEGHYLASDDLNKGKYGDVVKLACSAGGPLSVCQLQYRSRVSERYPREDIMAFPFPADQLAMFLYPNGTKLEYRVGLADPPPPQFLPLVFTGVSGQHNYAGCLTFYVRLAAEPSRKAAHFVRAAVDGAHSSSVAEDANAPGELRLEEFASSLAAFSDDGEEDSQSYLESSYSSIGTAGNPGDDHQRGSRGLSSARFAALAVSTHEPPEANPIVEEALQKGTIWAPVTLCAISRAPIYCALRTFLSHLLLASQADSGGDERQWAAWAIAASVRLMVSDLPLPLPGGRDFCLQLPFAEDPSMCEGGVAAGTSVPLSTPAAASLPLMDVDFAAPLRCLSPQQVISVFAMLLQECKVVFVSSRPALLTQVMESFRSLLFPLEWQSLYVPILPEPLMGCLEAPGSFMLGMQLPASFAGASLSYIAGILGLNGLAHCVNLDSSEILLASGAHLSSGRHESKLPGRNDSHFPSLVNFAAADYQTGHGSVHATSTSAHCNTPEGGQVSHRLSGSWHGGTAVAGGGSWHGPIPEPRRLCPDFFPLPPDLEGALAQRLQLLTGDQGISVGGPQLDIYADPFGDTWKEQSTSAVGSNSGGSDPASKSAAIKRSLTSFIPSLPSAMQSHPFNGKMNLASLLAPMHSRMSSNDAGERRFSLSFTDSGAKASVTAPTTGGKPVTVNQEAVRDLFLLLLADLLGNIGSYLLRADVSRSGMQQVFDTEGFISSADEQSRPFLRALTSTQMFWSLVQQWLEASDKDAALVFFDHCVRLQKKRRNKEASKLSSPERLRNDLPVSTVVRLHHSSVIDINGEEVEGSKRDLVGRSSTLSRGGGRKGFMSTSASEELFLLDATKPPLEIAPPVPASGDVLPTHKGCCSHDLGSWICHLDEGILRKPIQDISPLVARIVACTDEYASRQLGWGGHARHMLLAAGPSVSASRQECTDSSAGSGLGAKSGPWRMRSPEEVAQEAQRAYAAAMALHLLCVPTAVTAGDDRAVSVTLIGLGIIQEMCSKGLSHVIDEGMWRYILVACGRIGGSFMRQVASSLFEAMRSNKISPNAVTYGLYTKALAEENRRMVFKSIGPTFAYLEDLGLLWCQAAAGDDADALAQVMRLRTRGRGRAPAEDGEAQAKIRWNKLRAALSPEETGEGNSMRSRALNVVSPVHDGASKSVSPPPTVCPSIPTKSVFAMWDCTSCPACAYEIMDEEIMGNWEHSMNEYRVECPRCADFFVPRLHFRAFKRNWAEYLGQDIAAATGTARDELDSVAKSSAEGVSERIRGLSEDDTATTPRSKSRPKTIVESPGSQDEPSSPMTADGPQPVGSISGSMQVDSEESVIYLSPIVLRQHLERLNLSHGEECLNIDWLRQHRRHLFYNFVWWMARLNLPLTLPLRSGMTGSADRRSSTRSYVPEEVVICWQRPLALLRCRQIMQRWSLSTSSDYFSDPPSSPHVLKSFLPPPPLAILFPGSRAQVQTISAVLSILRTQGGRGLKNALLILNQLQLYAGQRRISKVTTLSLDSELSAEPVQGLERAGDSAASFCESTGIYSCLHRLVTNFECGIQTVAPVDPKRKEFGQPAFEQAYVDAVLSIVEAKSSVGVDKAAESKGGRPPSGQAPQVDAAALKMLDQLPQARALCYRSVFGQLD